MIRNIQGYSGQTHKNFRLDLVHGLVQPFLDEKDNGELVVQRRKSQIFMQPGYKEIISRPACTQDAAFVGLVDTRKEKMESKPKKTPAIIVKKVKCSFARNALKVFTPKVRSEHH